MKHLKKAQAAEDAGVYGNVPAEPDPDNAGSANDADNANNADNGEPHPTA